MPVRTRQNRRRRSAHITPEAVELFRLGMRDPHNQDIRIRLAAALGRSKFRASPLDARPHSLIGGDAEPIGDVLGLRTQLLKKLEQRFQK